MFHFYILPCFRKDNIFIPWNNDWLNWLYKFMSFVFLLHFSMRLVCLFVLFFFFHFFDMLRMECRWLFCCAMLVMLRADWALRWSWGIFLIKFNHTNFDCGEPKLEKRFVACAAGEALHCFGIRDARNLCHGVIFF